MELKLYPVKKKIVEKPPRNLARFCGGGQGLSWAVEPRKEEYEKEKRRWRRTTEMTRKTKITRF
jgi:hypothetical protein